MKEEKCLNGEMWKLHKESGFYVSNLGRVYNPKTKNLFEKKIGRHGYYVVGGKYLHRYIAETWIKNPKGYPTVDHWNRNRLDNRISNLRWASYKMQAENEKHTNKTVYQYTKSGEFVKEWSSLAEVEKDLGIDHSKISEVRNNKPHRLTAGGYKWSFNPPQQKAYIDQPLW